MAWRRERLAQGSASDETPAHLLMTTPESLEVMLISAADRCRALFAASRPSSSTRSTPLRQTTVARHLAALSSAGLALRARPSAHRPLGDGRQPTGDRPVAAGFEQAQVSAGGPAQAAGRAGPADRLREDIAAAARRIAQSRGARRAWFSSRAVAKAERVAQLVRRQGRRGFHPPQRGEPRGPCARRGAVRTAARTPPSSAPRRWSSASTSATSTT